MKKITSQIKPIEWGDIVTKYPSSSQFVTTANFTAGTKNIVTDEKGSITKRPGSASFGAVPSQAKDLFEMIFIDGNRHLLAVENGSLYYTSGDGVFHLVTSGYSTSSNFEFTQTQDRTYFDNGSDSPQVYDKTSSYGGVSYTVPQTKVMGAQAPVSAPSFAADSSGGSVPAGGHTYKVTFLYYGFEESNGGPSSVVHTVSNPNNTVNLTSIPIGGYGVTARNIYRDDTDGDYVLITTIEDNTTTTYADTSLTGTTPIPTDNGVPPTFGLIASWLDRIWIAKIPGNPYILEFSSPGLPDIFPGYFTISCNEQDQITGLVVFQGRLIVFNRHSFGQILGYTSDTFAYNEITNNKSSVGCVDNRSIQIRVVDGTPLLIWLSDHGFYSFDGSNFQYISDSIQDIVNNNLQQSNQEKGSNNQSSEADFEAGTFSDGITVTQIPGEITTRGYLDGTSTVGTNPRRTWDSQADWVGGSFINNLVTLDGSNTIKLPTELTPSIFDYSILSGNWIPGTGGFSGYYWNHNTSGPDVPGTIQSPIVDTGSVTITTLNVSLTTKLNNGGDISLYTSDDGITFTFSNSSSIPTNSGSSPQTTTYNWNLNNHRFFQIQIHDAIGELAVNDPVYDFGTTGTWQSETIDTTLDSTTYNSLTDSATIPSGCSLSFEIATSSSPSGPWTYVPFGSVTVLQYARIQFLFTGDIVATPTVSLAQLTWTLTSNFISSIIDTNTTPAAWDIFQVSYMSNGGTITFYMRSASTSGGISSATFFLVTPGSTPPSSVIPLRYVQWKIIITSSDGEVPEVNGVTVNWFIGSATNLRLASIFFNGRYYLSAAELDQTFNSIIFEYDLDEKWRIHRDQKVGALSYYRSNSYFGDDLGNIYQWLTLFQDVGTNITSDIRFRAEDYSVQGLDNSEFLKTLDFMILQGVGTGASYQVWFSVDEGNTFTLLDYEDGTTSFTSTNDGKNFYAKFTSNKSDGNLLSGKTVMIRITNSDQFNINVIGIKSFAWAWEFEPFLLG